MNRIRSSVISVNFRESYDTVLGLTPEFDGLSHKDQIKLKEIEVGAVMWSLTAGTAERDDPDALPSNPFIFLLTLICLDNLRSSVLLPATITCHGESRANFTGGAAFPKYLSVVPVYVEEFLGKKIKKIFCSLGSSS